MCTATHPLHLMLVPNLEYAKFEMCTNILKLLSSVNLWDAGVSRAWQGYWQEQLKSHLSAYSLDSANLSYDLECVHRHVFLGLVLPGRSHSLSVSGHSGLRNRLAWHLSLQPEDYCIVLEFMHRETRSQVTYPGPCLF